MNTRLGSYIVKQLRLLFIVTLIICPSLHAIVINSLKSLGHYYDRSKDILIVKCISVPDRAPYGYMNGFYPAEIEILDVLEGESKLGKGKMATIYSMAPGQRYLVSSMGGSAFGSDILAIHELSLVKLSPLYDIEKNRDLHRNEKVYKIFKSRQHAVNSELSSLEKEREALARVVGKPKS